MISRRNLITIRLFLIKSPVKRADYLRKKGVFHSIGCNVMITPRKVPLYAKLISIGNNVWIASGVSFITHDVIHFMLNQKIKKREFKEKIGCIKIGDNVFIGANSTILYDVKIGSNVIIGTGTLVTKDIPDNCVVAGTPARIISSFDSFVLKRKNDYSDLQPNNENQSIDPICSEQAWELFKSKRRLHDEK